MSETCLFWCTPLLLSRRYLEKNFTEFEACELDQLVKHALTALKETVQSGELNAKNCSIGMVGPDGIFKVFGYLWPLAHSLLTSGECIPWDTARRLVPGFATFYFSFGK